jgi:hypothetical protein
MNERKTQLGKLISYSPSAFKHNNAILKLSNKSLNADLSLSNENSSSFVVADFSEVINLSNLG